MTEIEELKQQLQKQEKLASLGMLSAGIAHEIQNPLNFVINFSKMSDRLLGDLEDIITPLGGTGGAASLLPESDREDLTDIVDSLKENMEQIKENGERAVSIIQSILLISRGKENERMPADVCNIVKEYVRLSYHAMRANHQGFNVTLHEQYQEGMPPVMVIPQDLSRAVLNVMNNACYAVWQKSQKASPDPSKGEEKVPPSPDPSKGEEYVPEISISVALKPETSNLKPETSNLKPQTSNLKPEETSLVISITDNGEGMTEEVKQRLFENFFTTKPIGQGTGLGMSITRDIIENKHGGKVDFTSTLGVGTTFTFTIPVGK